MPKKYPSCIVPRPRFRYRLPMRKLLCDYPDLAVVRRSEERNPFVFSSSGKRKRLRDDALGSSLIEMSVNLMGGLYKMNHLPFNPVLELVENDWNGKYIPEIPVPEESYSIKEEWGVVAFRVIEANAFTFPYTKSIKKIDYSIIKDQAERAKMREGLKIDEEIVGALGGADNDMTKVYGWLHVNHHPNDLNYWHMQIDVYKPGCDEYIKGGGKGENRRINHQLRVYISNIAICELGYSYYIGRKYYQYGICGIYSIFDNFRNWFCRKCIKFPYSPVLKEA